MEEKELFAIIGRMYVELSHNQQLIQQLNNMVQTKEKEIRELRGTGEGSK